MSSPDDTRTSTGASRARVIGFVILAIIGLNALGALISSATESPSGPPSSSYATSARGLGAYAELLERFGHTVARVRGSLSDVDLDVGGTAVVIDAASLSIGEQRALEDFVSGGGRLVVGGTTPIVWLGPLMEDPPQFVEGGAKKLRPLAPVSEVEEVSEVTAAGEGSWHRAEGTLPLLGDDSSTVATVANVDRGRVVFLADPSILQNRLLDETDNAAFALGLAAPQGSTVYFLENVHGYSEKTGLAALPERWRWALMGIAAAGLVWMVARGRRLGPPEDEARPLPPARQEYVGALAANLARTRSPAEALAPVRTAALNILTRRANLPADADASALREAGKKMGLPPDELDALLGRPQSKQDVVAVGRALARLRGGRT